MKSNYEKLGKYIREIDDRNAEDVKENLLGVSTRKVFIESIANTVGTDFTTYRLIKRGQFAYVPDTSRRGDKIGVALLDHVDDGMISQAYTVFEVTNENSLLPEYLMMWFRRPEFDRYARYMSYGSVREIFSWEDMCDLELPIPHIDKQREIVKEYNTILRRIDLNNGLIQKLEETAQAIYKQWFVDFEFPNENREPYKSAGGEIVESEWGEYPRNWGMVTFESIVKTIIDNRGKTPPLTEDGEKLLFETFLLNNEQAFPSTQRTSQSKYVSQDVFDTWFRSGHPKHLDILLSTVGAGIPSWTLTPKNADFCIAQNIIGLRLVESVSPFYLRSFFSTSIFKSQFEGRVKDTAQPSIRVKDIKTILVIKPSKNVMDNYHKLVLPIYTYLENKVSENSALSMTIDILLSKLATVEN